LTSSGHTTTPTFQENAENAWLTILKKQGREAPAPYALLALPPSPHRPLIAGKTPAPLPTFALPLSSCWLLVVGKTPASSRPRQQSASTERRPSRSRLALQLPKALINVTDPDGGQWKRSTIGWDIKVQNVQRFEIADGVARSSLRVEPPMQEPLRQEMLIQVPQREDTLMHEPLRLNMLMEEPLSKEFLI
jgi:hypothetical protein